MEKIDANQLTLTDKVVHINRCAKVVKGGRRFRFSALVVVGDGNGVVGAGIGKAKEVAEAIRKGGEQAKKNLIRIPVTNRTIPYEVTASFGAGRVMLKPASEGTGIIAGSSVRAVVELAGIHNILSKSLGTSNPFNVICATLECLKQLRSWEEIKQMRSVNG